MPGELIPIVLFIMAGLTTIGYPIARAMGRKIDRGSVPNQMSRETEARIERMEHAIESIAIEIERISEAQRFTTRLLSEGRTGRLPAAGDAREG